LLVIVLTTATFITTGQIPVNLAKAGSASERHDRPIIVTVTAEGGLFVDDHPLVDAALETVLQDRGGNRLCWCAQTRSRNWSGSSGSWIACARWVFSR
jgi:biopolymer transport protein ExbD